MTDLEGAIADRYVLEDRVAIGGIAEVWRAHDRVLARTVAVKMLHQHLETDASFVDNFRREALSAARLTHSNIVAIYDSGEHGTGESRRDYIVTEHCASSLRDYLRDRPLPEIGTVASIGKTLCDALAHAHELEIVHLDLKPDNIYVGEEGALKIADFGIARAALVHSADIDETATILGELHYMSPEVLRSGEGDARSDIYSLGAVLYELLTGRPPFDEGSVADAMEGRRRSPRSPRTVKAGVPRPIDAAVMRALAEDPGDRWQSAAEFGRALEPGDRAGATAPLRKIEPAPPRPPRNDDRGGRWLAMVIVAIVLAVGAALTIPSLLDDDEDGGPRADGGPPAAGDSIEISEAADFDPYGGDGEHPEDVERAIDGDPDTAWDTQDYESTLSNLKPGVGILLDLGEATPVGRITISGSDGTDIEIRVGDESPVDETSLEEVTSGTLDGSTDFDVGGAEGRYWLVWITDLPGGVGGTAEIYEVELFGS